MNRRRFVLHGLSLACGLLVSPLWAAAPRKALQVKLVCTQKDSHGKTEGQHTYLLTPASGYSYTVRLNAGIAVRLLSSTASSGAVTLRYYILHGSETFGPAQAVLTSDSDPVQSTFYLGESTLLVQLSPTIASVAAAAPVVAKKPAGPQTEDCPSCDGSGKCADCGGTGKLTCKVCKGSGACQICGGSGQCPFCGNSGQINGFTCIHCNGSGDCAACSASGSCFACHGKGYTKLCDACEGSGACATCGGSGQVPLSAPATGHK